VSRYLQQLKRIPDESKASQWHAFLINHREVIAVFDFSPFPTSIFVPCTASLSNMPVGAFCISMLHSIQSAIGLCNNSAKHSRCQALIDMSCSTTIPSLRIPGHVNNRSGAM
jgi:hypothetical protein